MAIRSIQASQNTSGGPNDERRGDCWREVLEVDVP